MVLITASTTIPVNPSGSTPTLTKEDLWIALVLKARDPKQFVPVIESSEVISENENRLTRKVSFKGDDASKDGVEERVVFVGGMKVDFHIPATGQVVSNIISTSPADELFLTFTFEWPHPELRAGSVEVKELEARRGELSRGVVPHTVEVARGLKRDGVLRVG